jgi:hypothetical protein
METGLALVTGTANLRLVMPALDQRASSTASPIRASYLVR